MKKLLFLVSVLFCLSVPAQNVQEEFDQRAPLMKKIIYAAKCVAQISEDQEAMKVADFLEKSAILACFRTNGQVALIQVTNVNSKFALIPLLKRDMELPFLRVPFPEFEKFGGMYTPENRTMFVNMTEPHSSWAIASVALHEGRHAMQWLVDGETNLDSSVLYRQEVAVRAFDQRIRRKVGGTSYLKALSNEVARITRILEDNHEKIGDIYPIPSREYDSNLNVAFDPFLSEREMRSRISDVWIDAIMQLLDATYLPPELMVRKVDFIRSVYDSRRREYVQTPPK